MNCPSGQGEEMGGQVREVWQKNDIVIEGIVYAPQWKMNISGNGEINQNSRFFTMVADTFYLEGNGRLHVKSDAAAAGFPEVMPKIKTGPVILE